MFCAAFVFHSSGDAETSSARRLILMFLFFVRKSFSTGKCSKIT